MPTLILLPGMDGTGELFAPLIDALGDTWTIRCVRYPARVPLDYGALETLAARALPTVGPYWLLGESFSGPVAITLAARHPAGLRGLVLCATFARNPYPALGRLRHGVGALARLPLPLPLPLPLLDALLLGRFATPRLRALLGHSVAQVAREVLIERVRAVLHVDVVAQLQAVRVPLLYLCASEDRLVRRCASQAMKVWRPDLQWIELTAPHALLQCAPREAAECLRAFVHASAGIA